MSSLVIVGAGQFAGQFAKLFLAHPGVSDVYVTAVIPDQAEQLCADEGLAGTFASYEAMLASDAVDAVAIFTQRWTHGPLIVQGPRPASTCTQPCQWPSPNKRSPRSSTLSRPPALTYMMGESSQYNPATVQWKETASYPPLLYPTHSIGGVLGAWQTHAVSVSAIGVTDDRGDGVFDEDVSQFDNDVSNATALFEVAGGGSFRTNEFRRVGYPSQIRESRFRFFRTEASMEQLATVAFWQDKRGIEEISELLEPKPTMSPDDPSLQHIAPDLRAAFISGSAPVHDRERLPREFDELHNGHEGSHHFLVDDFVSAVNTGGLPPVNAWVAARYTLPGIVAHQSSRQGGARLPIPDFGDAPTS